MSNPGKGAGFERHVCKVLSLWWSVGLHGKEGARDDIFWRTSQSGGRATQRAKAGKSTYGSYGDIAAVDPVGSPLLKVFTIELKRGNSHGNPVDLFDAPETDKVRSWERCLSQAMTSHQQARTMGWLLFLQRDRRLPIVCIDLVMARRLSLQYAIPNIRYRVAVNGIGLMSYVSMPLGVFLKSVKPKQIIELLK